jgi:hypothetical protein
MPTNRSSILSAEKFINTEQKREPSEKNRAQNLFSDFAEQNHYLSVAILEKNSRRKITKLSTR